MLCARCEKLMFCSPSCDPRVLGRSLFFLQLALYGPTIPSTVLFELRESWGMRTKPLLSQVRGPRGGKWDLTSCLATAMDSPRRCILWFTEHLGVLTFMSSSSLRQAVWLSGTSSRALGSDPAPCYLLVSEAWALMQACSSVDSSHPGCWAHSVSELLNINLHPAPPISSVQGPWPFWTVPVEGGSSQSLAPAGEDSHGVTLNAKNHQSEKTPTT